MDRNLSKPEFPVEAVAWDLSMGVATTGFGRLILKGTIGSSYSAPDSIDHVGIIVFNRLYEYGNRGLMRNTIPKSGVPMPEYPAFKLRKREFLGHTLKTREELVEWILIVRYREFRCSEYDMYSHNCLHFAMAACDFLQVDYPKNWIKICNWAEQNKKLGDLIVRCAERFQRRSSLMPKEANNNTDNKEENTEESKGSGVLVK